MKVQLYGMIITKLILNSNYTKILWNILIFLLYFNLEQLYINYFLNTSCDIEITGNYNDTLIDLESSEFSEIKKKVEKLY